MNSLTQRIREYYRHVDTSLRVHPAAGTLESDRAMVARVGALFSPHAVYERDGSEVMRGKDAITQFFAQERSLCGQHLLHDVRVSAGVDERVADAVTQYFSGLNPKRCMTVQVQGTLRGAHCFTDGSAARFVNSASGMDIPFHDYWVVAGDQVLYRYSQLAQGYAQEVQQRRNHAVMGRR